MDRPDRPHRRGARVAIAVIACALAAGAIAAPWTPVGPADGGGAPAFGAIATHPAVGGQAMIVAGAVDGIAPAATFFTTDAGAHWSANARHGGLGRVLLGGSPTIAYLASAGTVLRSADQGRSWAPLALPFASFQPPPPNGIPRVGAVSPVDGNEFVAIGGDRVARSVDGGASWTTDTAPSGVAELAVDWSTRTIYATLASGGAVAHRSLDAPGAWSVAGSDAQVFSAGQGVALYQTSAGALYRSIDGGATFLPVAQVPGKLALCDLAFAAAPATRVYGLECTTRRVLRSDDGGATFGLAGMLAPGLQASSLAVDAADSSSVYVVTSRGVLRSSNAGATFVALDRSTGAPGRGRSLLLDAKSAILRYLTDPPGPGAGYSRSTNAGQSWSEVAGGRRLIAVSRDRAEVVFGAVGDGQDGDAEFSLSEDGGQTWFHKLDAFGASTRFGPMAYGANAGEIYLYASSPNEAGLDARIFVSADDGGSWVAQDPPLVVVKAIATTQRTPLTIYAGGIAIAPGAPQLFRSTDASTWTPVATFPGPAGLGNEITTILVDPAEPQRIWVGFRDPDYLMYSGDGGATWTRRVSGLGAGAITSIVKDPASGALHATQRGGGLFRSGNGGTTWSALDAGLHDDVVLRADFDGFVANRLYASTGSGLFAADASVAYPTGDRRAIEFHHADMNHYFVSADLPEIAGLDDGTIAGWTRTGEGFRVAEGSSPGNQPVCRLFGVGFAPKSTHLYTPYAYECEILKGNPDWLYEKIAFGLALPEPPPTRGCPPGTRALFRLWNAGQGGAPNHRYTTSLATLDAMIGQGWIYEGEVPTRVFACTPY